MRVVSVVLEPLQFSFLPGSKNVLCLYGTRCMSLCATTLVLSTSLLWLIWVAPGCCDLCTVVSCRGHRQILVDLCRGFFHLSRPIPEQVCRRRIQAWEDGGARAGPLDCLIEHGLAEW